MTGTPGQPQTYILKTSARGWQGPVSDLARLLARRFHVPEDTLLVALARGEEAVLAAGVGAECAEELAGVLARIGAQPVVEVEGGLPARAAMRRTQASWATLDEGEGKTQVEPPPDPRALGQAARVAALTPRPAGPSLALQVSNALEGPRVLGVTPSLPNLGGRPLPRHSLAVPGVPLPATGSWERPSLPASPLMDAPTRVDGPPDPALARPSGTSSSSQRAARVFSHQEAQAYLEAAQAEPAQERVRPISQPTLADPEAALRALEDALVPEGSWQDTTVGQLRKAIQGEAPEPSRAPAAPLPGVLEGWAQALQPQSRPKRHDSFDRDFQDLWGQIVTPGQEPPVSFDADPHSDWEQSAEVDLGAPPSQPTMPAAPMPALDGWGALLGPAMTTTTGPTPAVVVAPPPVAPSDEAWPEGAEEVRAEAVTPTAPARMPTEAPALPVGGWSEAGARGPSGKGRAPAVSAASGGERRVSPTAALWAGLAVPGGGQALMGELGRAVWVGVGAVLVVPWLWGAWDAKRDAQRRTLGEEQGGWRVWGAYALCYVLCISALVVVGRVAVERRWILGGDEEKARERLLEQRIIARGAALQGVERAFYRANREREGAEAKIDPRTVLKPGDPGYGVSPRVRAEQLAERLEAARTACALGRADLCEQLAQEALGLEPSSREAWSLVVKARELRATAPPQP